RVQSPYVSLALGECGAAHFQIAGVLEYKGTAGKRAPAGGGPRRSRFVSGEGTRSFRALSEAGETAGPHRGGLDAYRMPAGFEGQLRGESGLVHDRPIEYFQCLLLAQSGHPSSRPQCPLLGVKRTLSQLTSMSAFDPKRTSACQFCRGAWRSLNDPGSRRTQGLAGYAVIMRPAGGRADCTEIRAG